METSPGDNACAALSHMLGPEEEKVGFLLGTEQGAQALALGTDQGQARASLRPEGEAGVARLCSQKGCETWLDSCGAKGRAVPSCPSPVLLTLDSHP